MDDAADVSHLFDWHLSQADDSSRVILQKGKNQFLCHIVIKLKTFC